MRSFSKYNFLHIVYRSVYILFSQIPSLLSHHQVFLDELKKRLEQWDVNQKVGDVFLDMVRWYLRIVRYYLVYFTLQFSKPVVIENYTNYVNNWKRARDIIKNAQQSKPAFARFLEVFSLNGVKFLNFFKYFFSGHG